MAAATVIAGMMPGAKAITVFTINSTNGSWNSNNQSIFTGPTSPVTPWDTNNGQSSEAYWGPAVTSFSNAITGVVTLNNLYLGFTNSNTNYLGSTGGGGTITFAGTSEQINFGAAANDILSIYASLIVTNTLTINGGSTALLNLYGSNFFTNGTITEAGGSAFRNIAVYGTNYGGTYNLYGMTIANGGLLTNANINFTSTGGTLTVNDTNQAGPVLSLSAPINFLNQSASGNTITVNSSFNGVTGSAISAQNYTLQAGNTINFNNASTNATNNTFGSSTITLSGGSFAYSAANSGANSVASLPSVIVTNNIASTISFVNASTSNNFLLGNITRNDNSMLQFSIANAGTTGRVALTNSGSNLTFSGGILAWAVDTSGGGFITTNNVTGTNYLIGTGASTNANAKVADINAAAATDNYRFAGSGATNLNASTTVNSLYFAPSAAGTLSLGANTLTVASGGILQGNAPTMTITNGVITVGNGSGAYNLYLWNTGSMNLIIGSQIADNGGNSVSLFKAGGTASILSASNSYTGATVIEGGSLINTNTGDLRNSAVLVGSTNMPTGATFYNYGIVSNVTVGIGSAIGNANTNFYNSGTILGRLNIVGGTNGGFSYNYGNAGLNYGIGGAYLDTGTVVTNVLLSGHMYVGGSGSMTVSGIVGDNTSTNSQVNFGTNFFGKGVITINNTYTNANSSGGQGVVLSFANGFNAIQSLNLNINSGQGAYFTLAGGSGSTNSFATFGYSSTGTPIINGITFSGGTWLLGIIGQNNSNGKDSSTHTITNGAIVNVATSYGYVGAPTFNINQGSLNFTNASGGTIANSVRLTNSSLVINVNGSGTFTDAATLTLGNGNAAQIAAGQTSMLNINGGQAFIGGAVILGNGTNNGNTNDYSFLGVSNNGVLTLSNNLTLGDGFTHVNQSNTVTLASGTMIVTGTIAPGAGASGASNSFFWTGGTLSAGTISATNTAAQSAWTGAAAGSSISNNTLYNTNSGTLLVGNSTNGYAGRTTINGNYTQNGSATTTFNIFGTTAAGSWTGATNNYSQLLISGTALYGGTVALNMTGYDLATSAATTLTLATNASYFSSLTNATLAAASTNGTIVTNSVGGYTNFTWLNTNGYGGYVLASSATNLTFTTAVNNWLGGANWGSGGTNGWNLGINPNTTKTVAYFGTNTGAALTVTNDAPVTVGGLVFSNSSGYTIVSTGTGSLTLDGSALGGTAMIRNQAGSHTISEAVTLATAMELTNSGAGSVTFTGGIYGPGAIAVDSGSLIFTNSVANIVSNSISGAGSVLITGPNTVTTLSGSNTFAGGLTLQSYSTMILGSTNAVGKGLFYWGGATISSLVDLSGGNALTNAVTISSGFDYVAGTNSITLAGAVTQTGGNRSIINNLSNNGVLTLSGPVYLDSGATARNLALSGTGNTVVSGSIADSSTVTNGSALTKSGTGTLTLSGSNSFTGGTTVSDGKLALSNSNALGATGSLTLSGGTLSMGAYNATVGAVTIGNAALTFDSGGGTLTATSYAATNTVALTLSNSLAGTGTLTKTGAGTLTLTGVNSYLGGTTLSGGVLSLGSASAIGSSGTLTFNGGTLQYGSSNTTDYSGRFATNASQAFNFDLNGQNVTFANGLTNGGTTTLSVTNSTAGNGTLTLSGNNSITGAINNNASALNLANSGSQTLSSVISGVGTLIQSGTGTTTLAAQNTYTNTVVNGGTLNVTSGGSAGGIRGALTINSGGTVNLIGTNALGYSAGGAVTNITINGGTLNDALSNAGLVSMGLLQSIFMTGGTVASTTNNSAMNFGVANTAAITTYSNNATATFADNITLRATNISFNVAQGTAPGGIDLLVSGFIGQNGVTANITKTGAGTMLLSASNSYTGGTLISAGTLALTNGAVLGGGNVTNNASLVVSRTDSSTLTNAIFGNGSLTASGTGTVIFSGAQSYTGQTIITNGTLQLGNGSATGSLSSSSTIVDNGTLAFNRSNAVAQGTDFASTIRGFGGIAQIGTGTVTLSGNNTYAGTTAISAGVLAVTGSGSLGSGAVANNGMLTLNSSANFAIGSMSGAGTFTEGGSGTVTLTGSPGSFSGSGTVTAGTLALANGAGMPGGNLAVNSGATIAGAGLLGNVTLNSGSTVAVTSGATAGKLTVSSLIVNGGTYTWNYQGSANDLITSTGTIDFSALTGSKQLTIGAFTNATSASWPTGSTNFTVMTANGGFTGFDATKFNISSFSTLSGGVGNWSIGTNGNSLVVSYQGGQLYALVASPGTTTSQSAVTNAFSGGSLSSVALFGGGEYILDLTNNYGGQTTIGAGTLTATGTNSFAQSSVIQVGTLTNSNAAATLNINTAGGVVTNAINVVGKGLNTITGTNAGVVTYGGNVALNTNVTLASVAGGDVILSGTVSGAGTATVSGAGTVTLAAGNTYSGGTVLNSGTLAVSNNAALGSGTLTVTRNSTVQALTSVTLANNATITNGVTETLDANGNNLTNSGNISGQGAILARSSTGAGTVTLSGSNSYTGASTVDSGTLVLGNSNALPSGTALSVSNTGTLDVNGLGILVSSLNSASGGVITNSASTTNTLTVSNSTASTYNGVLAGKLALTENGGSTLTLGGVETYTGATVIGTNSTLQISSSGLLGNGNYANTIAIGANGSLALGQSGSQTLSGAVSGAGSVTFNGTGTTVLNNSANPTGGVTISSGLVRVGISNALSTVTLSGGVLDLNGLPVGAGGGGVSLLDGGSTNGVLTNSSSTQSTFQIGNSSSGYTSTFGGTIAGGTNATNGIALSKYQASTAVLSGTGTLTTLNINTGNLVFTNNANFISYGYTGNGTNGTIAVGGSASLTITTAGGTSINLNNWLVSGGTVNLNNDQRFGLNTTGQTFTQTGGTFNVVSNSFGVRLGDINGTGATGPTSVTLNQTGGLFNLIGNGTTLGGFTLGSAGSSAWTDSYTLGGGTLSINAVNNGANSGGQLTVGADTNGLATSTFYLNGGKLAVNGTVTGQQTAGAKQAFVWNGGQLSVGTFVANNLASAFGSTNYGTLSNSAGTLAPGTVGTAGKLNITGNYVQGGNAAMAIDLNGSAPATAYQSFPGSYYDTVAVSSNATLGGDLLLSIGNGFAPASNNSFSVLTASNVTGMINGAHTSLVNGATKVVATDGLSIFKATNTGTALNLTNYTFNQYAGGAWGSGGASSWTAVDPNSGVYTAYFGTNGGSGSVVMDQNRTVSALLFSNAVASSLTASGGSVLTLTNNAGVTTNASLTVSAGGLTLNAPVNLQSGLVITDTAGTSVDVKGNISESVTGSGVTIASNNTGLVTFYGTNSYTGATVVNGGYLDLTGTNALAAANLNTNKLSVGTGATLIFGVGGSNAYSSAQINAALASGAFKSGSGIGYDATGTNFTLSSLGAVSSLTLAGSGTATVNQDNSGLSNGITLLGGTLAVGPSTTTANALGGSRVSISLNSTNASKIDLGGTVQAVGNINNNNALGGMMVLTNGVLNIAPGNSGNIATFGGLQESADASIVSPGIVALTTVNGSYSSSSNGVSVLAGSNAVSQFYLQGGSLALENNHALDGSILTITAPVSLLSTAGFTNAGAVSVDFSGSSSMNIAGTIDFGTASVNAGTTTLNVASNGALVLTNGVSGGALTKAGSGTLILGGSNGTAGTTLNGGTILALGANSLGANLTLSSGLLDLGGNTDTFSTVGFYGTNYTVINGSFTVTSGYTASNTAIAQSLSGGATFTSLGGNVYLTNANTYTGATLVTGGTLYSSLNTNTTYTVTNAGSTFVAGAAIDTNWTAASVASVKMNNGTILAIDATGTNFALKASLTNGANFTLGTYGTGTVTLANSATNYTGVSMLAISSGTLDLGGVSVPAQMTLTNVTISGGTITNGTLSTTNLVIAANANANIAANLVGTGGLTITNGDIITLSASNGYTGTTLVRSNGVLSLNNAGAIANSGNLTVNAGGVLYVTNAGVQVLSTNGANGFNLNITGANTNTANFVITNGASFTYCPDGNGVSANWTTSSVVIGNGSSFIAANGHSGLFINSSLVNIQAGGTMNISGDYQNNFGSSGTNNRIVVAGTLIGASGNGTGMGGATGLNEVDVVSGGVWTNGTIKFAGGTSASTNKVDVASGGLAYIGFTIGTSGSAFNQITNAGIWTNSTASYIGNGATGTNEYDLTGSLVYTANLTIGGNNSSTNTTLNLLNVYSGGYLSNAANSLYVGYGTTNGTNVANFAAGSTANIYTVLIAGGTGSNSVNTLTNAGTVTSANLSIGNVNNVGNYNQLLNSGSFAMGQLSLGAGSNSVVMNVVSNTGTMSMGQFLLGNGNGGTNLFYSSGTVTNTAAGSTGFEIGANSNSTGLNEVILNGGTFSNTGGSTYGYMNYGGALSGTNLLSLSNGATFGIQKLQIGYSGSAYNLVTNAGGSMYFGQNLVIGYGASNSANTFYLGNGTVTSAASLGNAVGGGGYNETNKLVIASGGVFTSTVTTSIGSGGTNSQNTMTLGAGGRYDGTGIIIGSGGNNNSNLFEMTGAGTFTGNSQFYLGSGGASNTNTMSVASGGVFTNSNWIQMQGANSTDLFTNNGGSVTATGLMMGAYGASNSSITYAQGSGTTTIGGSGIQLATYGSNLGNSSTNTIEVAGGVFNSTNATTTLGAAGTNNLNIFQVDGGQANLTTVTMGATTNTNSSGGTNQINLNGGTLSVSQITAGAGSAAAGSVNQVNLNGGTLLAASGASSTFLGAGVATVAITGSGTINDGGQAITVGATIADGSSVGQLIKAGAGTLTLSGKNTYSAGTLLNAGGVNITTGSSLGLGNLTMAGGTTLGYTGTGASTLANNISLSSGNGTIANSSGSALNLSGNLSDNGSLLTFAKGSYNVSGNITGAYVLSNAVMTLSGLNSYSAPASIFAGSTLNLGAHGSLTDSSVLNLGASSDSSKTTNTFNLGGYNQSLTSLATTGGGYNQVINSGSFSTLTLTGTSTFGGSFNGANIGLTIAGGNVTLTGTSSYTGTTTVNGGSLDLGSTAFLTATSNVVVQNGGTLLLGGTSANQIHANTPITMNGGTLSMGGNGTKRAVAQSFASLTLTGNSVIDFANLTGDSSLTFGTIALNNNSLSIYNWSGTNQYGTQSSTQVGTFTHLYDLNSGSLSSADLNNISFYSGGLGSTFLGNAAFSGNEIVPVPEPGVIVAAALLLGWLLFSNRRLLMAVVTRRRA
jgi:autotransporter-associated beta strand protein